MRVLVLGGGVAGLASALALARAGHDVQLVDKDTAAWLRDVTRPI